MRKFGLFSLSVCLGLGSACSFHSLERLDNCRRSPELSECQGGASAAGRNNATAGTEQSGGASAGTTATGGAPEAGATQDPAGAAGTSGGEGGAGGARETPPGLVVLYADYSESDVDPAASVAIRAAFVIENRSDVEVSLRDVTLRYYYTLEAASQQTFECDFVSGPIVDDCKGIMLSFGTLAAADAKNYIELSFAAPDGEWILPALGGKSGVMRLRFNKQDFSLQDQSNDYSFVAGDSAIPTLENEHVTLYLAGKRVYGIEPN